MLPLHVMVTMVKGKTGERPQVNIKIELILLILRTHDLGASAQLPRGGLRESSLKWYV
jgi:hypothetical protein